jgi:hypothetical protein
MMVFRSNADLVGQNPDRNFELFLAMIPNTLLGTDVVVSLNGGLSVIAGIDLTFSEVTADGNTIVVTSAGGPPPPTGFKVVGLSAQPVYYDINTTATFSGPVTVCIKYDETQVHGTESKLKLTHHDGTGFVDVTTSLDVANNVICGTTTALSPFAIMEPESAPSAVGGIAELPEVPRAGLQESGSSAVNARLLAGLAPGAVLLVATAAWYARRRWHRRRV